MLPPPFLGEETETNKEKKKPPPSPTAQGGSARIQVHICFPPTPLFFPPHHADPVKADAAEIKVTRRQASGIRSSCTTGMSSVMTRSSLPALHTQSCPHPSCGTGTRKARAGVFPTPTQLLPQGVRRVNGGMGLESHSCLCLPRGSWKGPQPRPGLSFCRHKQNDPTWPACVTGRLVGVVSVTGGGDLKGRCYAVEVSPLCLPVLASLGGLHRM